MPELARRAEVAREVALAAGSVLRRVRGVAAPGHARKADGSYVTDADLRSEALIRDEIARRFPRDALVAEEGDTSGPGAAAYTWVVDPLDGTTNYLNGLPDYAVAIAVVGRDGGYAAVVNQPAHGIVASCVRGGGTRAEGAPAAPTERARPLLALGLASVVDVRRVQLPAVARWMDLDVEAREVGSASVSLARVALGQYDGYVEPGLPPWDVVPGVLLAREAGLAVRSPATEPVAWPTAPRADVVVLSAAVAALADGAMAVRCPPR